ncbi:hypothetical protein AI28_22335 [bacteria symbiont BFo1 of Frankliniella occidentalis]|nr:hypothetical protein AI28_22335 [bacteria symbiont BFo1 of Frankliniella occidentalis]
MVGNVVKADAANQAVNVHRGDVRVKLAALLAALQHAVQYRQRALVQRNDGGRLANIAAAHQVFAAD